MRTACALIGIFVCMSAHAEIEKIAVPSETTLSFYWWPKVAPLWGWHHDRDRSIYYNANALAPDGFTFSDAESVMYARALYKPRVPEIKSLEALIENDEKDFEVNTPGVSIQEVEPLSGAEGQTFRSFTFIPTKKGNWERVSYGEEGDFYLIFTLSSRTQSGFNSSMPAYVQLVTSYKR